MSSSVVQLKGQALIYVNGQLRQKIENTIDNAVLASMLAKICDDGADYPDAYVPQYVIASADNNKTSSTGSSAIDFRGLSGLGSAVTLTFEAQDLSFGTFDGTTNINKVYLTGQSHILATAEGAEIGSHQSFSSSDYVSAEYKLILTGHSVGLDWLEKIGRVLQGNPATGGTGLYVADNDQFITVNFAHLIAGGAGTVKTTYFDLKVSANSNLVTESTEVEFDSVSSGSTPDSFLAYSNDGSASLSVFQADVTGISDFVTTNTVLVPFQIEMNQ